MTPRATKIIDLILVAPDDLAETIDARRVLIPQIESRCRFMHADGVAGHWAYNLPQHFALYQLLLAERIALATAEHAASTVDLRILEAA